MFSEECHLQGKIDRQQPLGAPAPELRRENVAFFEIEAVRPNPLSIDKLELARVHTKNAMVLKIVSSKTLGPLLNNDGGSEREAIGHLNFLDKMIQIITDRIEESDSEQ